MKIGSESDLKLKLFQVERIATTKLTLEWGETVIVSRVAELLHKSFGFFLGQLLACYLRILLFLHISGLILKK